MKKILILGGAPSQFAAIKYAVEAGYYVITCDYKPENPGHKISHKYYNISTTLKDDILKLCESISIDGISAFASDPAAPTAAFVSERLNIPSSGYEAVSILSDKGKYRNFLIKTKSFSPAFITSKSLKEIKDFISNNYNANFYIKPVDSSGSKGISLLKPNQKNIEEFFKYAISNSRKGEVIVEQEIIKKGPQIHGEGFVLNGELIFIILGDQYFSPINNHIPMSTTFPSLFHKDIICKCYLLVQKIISQVCYKLGGINIEIIRDQNDNLYLLELGARNGGNFMPQLAHLATNVDLISLNIEAVLANYTHHKTYTLKDNFCSQLIMHAFSDGILAKSTIPDKFHKYMKFENIYYKKGQYVAKYKSSNDVVGVQLFDFDRKEICEEFISFINNNSHLQIS